MDGTFVLIVLIFLILRVQTCVLHRARHVVRAIIGIPDPTEFQRRSVRMHFSCYVRVSCCTVRARQVVLSSLYRTFIQRLFAGMHPFLCSVKLLAAELHRKG